MRKWWYLWEEYSKKAYELYDYYHEIEVDLKIWIEEKKLKMLEWWGKHLDLLVKSSLHINDINKVINSGIIHFRDWIIEFINSLYHNNIPLVIISANWLWWDSIKLYFEKQNLFKNIVNIIWNELIWDEKWYAIWYKDSIIHVFNKDETVLKNYPEIHNIVLERKNVILLWDSMWDIHMIDGFDYDNLIKIWFLNSNVELQLDEYLKKYDIVITWDNDMSFINNFLKECF
jgi:HAD superfamily hydrolase (TIGR01544 family)